MAVTSCRSPCFLAQVADSRSAPRCVRCSSTSTTPRGGSWSSPSPRSSPPSTTSGTRDAVRLANPKRAGVNGARARVSAVGGRAGSQVRACRRRRPARHRDWRPGSWSCSRRTRDVRRYRHPGRMGAHPRRQLRSCGMAGAGFPPTSPGPGPGFTPGIVVVLTAGAAGGSGVGTPPILPPPGASP